MIGDRLSQVFHAVFLALFAVVVLYILAGEQEPFLLLALTAVSFAAVMGIYQILGTKNITDRRLNAATAVILIAMAAAMAVTGWWLIPKLRTDLGMVYYSAMEIIEDGKVSDVFNEHNEITTITNMTNNEYFVVYPNNLPILFLLTCFYRIVCGFGISMDTDLGVYMAILLNLAVILCSVWLGSRVARRLLGNRAAFFFLVIACLFVPYYINVSRFYTDTMTLPFPVLSIYLYLRLKESKSRTRSLLLAAGLGLCLAAGFLLKGSCLIVAVVLVIYGILEVMRRKVGIKRFALLVLTALLCFGGSVGGWNWYVRHASWIDMSREEELTFPMAHWVMMSMSGTGGYNRTDFDYTYSYPTKEEKSQADWERAREKIEGYGGLAGFLNFEFQKIAATWGDGKYTQQIHLTWNQKRTVIQDFTRTDGKYYGIFYNYTTVFVLTMYLFFLLSIGKGIWSKNSPRTLIHLCIFGALLFFAFWETKSRYLLNFTPVFFLCVLYGLEDSLPLQRGRHRMSGEHSNGKSPKLRSNKD